MFQMKKREVKGFKKQGVQTKISIKTRMCMHGCACTRAHTLSLQGTHPLWLLGRKWSRGALTLCPLPAPTSADSPQEC